MQADMTNYGPVPPAQRSSETQQLGRLMAAFH